MRRLLTWLVVTLGIAEIARRLRRRSQRPEHAELAPPSHEDDPADDPADELRRKLAHARSEEEPAEPPTYPPAASTVDERRAEVHDQGRSAVDEMREPDES